MLVDGSISLAAFLMFSSLTLLVATLIDGRKSRLDARLRDLSGAGPAAAERESLEQLARSTLPRLGAPLVPADEEERTLLQSRLIHAGLYGRQAMVRFLGIKMLLMIAPAIAGAFGVLSGFLPAAQGAILGIAFVAIGMIGPSFWLDRKKAARQTGFRRALPDALDVIVICLEGGLSLHGALQYVADDMGTAHPLLAAELDIVQREVQLGLSPGESIRKMADRADLEDLRGLAALIIQSDRLGASLVKSIRIHADMLRHKRRQRAEEMAQKSGTKVLFPTILFIFPTLFVVILTPGLIQIMEMFRGLN